MSYSVAQREHAFQAWYSAGQPSIHSFAPVYRCPTQQDPEVTRPVSKYTLEQWHERYGWVARARSLDAEAMKESEQRMIQERAEMLDRHRKIGRLLQRRGVEYMQQEELVLGSDHAAISSLNSGVHL